jgi:hypothetical protein
MKLYFKQSKFTSFTRQVCGHWEVFSIY